ncbi:MULTISPECIES: cyclase family protein [Anaerotruncus]|uniref:cyclase family protein n=1 Tax=Anaerotruncus TaxID=244127 RepID=UPI00082E4BBB|nr:MULTISPECIES: cyclase family protein [Anaerotruncus]RGX55202.1 cyclase family protein [Anaerotruncus sp. AF02-27]
MRIVDLSMPIISNMLANRDFAGNVYLNMVTHEDSKAFGSGAPDDPFTSAWNYIGMTEHTGTHVDAFFHMDPQGLSVDEMPLDLFFGKAVCLDLRQIPPRGTVTVADVLAAQEKAGVKIDGHIVLFCTGIHKKYYPSDDLLRMNPEISAEVVRWLAKHGSRMHGVEGPSTDILDKKLFPSHRACRELKLAHYEWLVNLEELLGKGEFMFYGVPLRLKGGSGSPVRAFAVIEEGN